MKALKRNISGVIFISILIIAGCSDNLISPVSTGQAVTNNSNSQKFDEISYDENFSLNPGETIILNYDNTHLILIHSYSISKCDTRTKGLLIRSSMQADSTSLPCSWKKHGYFAFEDLSIKNISNQEKIISVSLQGVRFND